MKNPHTKLLQVLFKNLLSKKTISSLFQSGSRYILLTLLMMPVLQATSLDYLSYGLTDGEITITHCDRGASGDLVIPQSIDGYPVVSIDVAAFRYCHKLETIELPLGLRTIENYAFAKCSGLKGIVIPNTVTSLGDSAFRWCDDLEWVSIPNSLDSLGKYAFASCFNLESVSIPSSITSVSEAAFRWCDNLVNIDMPNTLTTIDKFAFSSCYLLETVTIPVSVTSVENSAFRYCNSLENIHFEPIQAPYIGDRAFEGVDASSAIITYRNRATGYGNGSFAGLPAQEEAASVFGDYKYVIFANEATIVDYVGPDVAELMIPEVIGGYPLVGIGDSAFRNNSFTTVTVPEGVTRIGSYAFASSYNLECVEIPYTVSSIDDSAFRECISLQDVRIPKLVRTISQYSFEGCGSLQSLAIPDNVEIIADSAFRHCGSLENVQFSEGLLKIEKYAFASCSSLETIDVPENVKDIENSAFRYCNLNSVKVGNSEPSTDVYDSVGFLARVAPNASFEMIAANPTNIGSYAFAANNNLIGVRFDSMEAPSLGSNVFEGVSPLARVSYPNEAIGYDGSDVAGLAAAPDAGLGDLMYLEVTEVGMAGISVTITDCSPTASGHLDVPAYINGNLVEFIAAQAFQNCNLITSITIPDTVVGIGNNAFDGCSSLRDIDIPNSVTRLGSNAFLNCTSLESVVIPNRLMRINESTFKGCTALAEITIPSFLMHINDRAFEDCTALKHVALPKNLMDIGAFAFANCTSVREYYFLGRTAPMLSGGSNVFLGTTAIAVIPCYGEGYGTPGLYAGMPSSCESDWPLEWSINNNRTKRITHCEEPANGVLEIPEIIYGDPIQDISNAAFEDRVNLTLVTIPDRVTTIEADAFAGCTNLRGVLIGDRVQTIEARAFQDCRSLTSIRIPDSVTSIAPNAFERCYSLKSVIIGDSVISIGDNAFSLCVNLAEIECRSNTPPSLGTGAFRSISSVAKITYPNSATYPAVFGGVATLRDFAWTNLADISQWRTKDDGAPTLWDFSPSESTINLSRPGTTNEEQENLYSVNEYLNFEMLIEWKLPPNEDGNSGIIYRLQGKQLEDGVEYQILDDSLHDHREEYDGFYVGQLGNHHAGSIYDFKGAPYDKLIFPVGHWNRTRIVVNGSVIEHYLNGELVATIDQSTAEWSDALAKSKFSSRSNYGLLRGKVLLQDHSNRLWFRDVRIREL